MSRLVSKQSVLLLAAFVFLALVPGTGSRYYVFLFNEMLIFGLFAISLNLVLGYTGLVPFGHAAYFGLGAYACGILIKRVGLDSIMAILGASVFGGFAALIIGFFCVRLTKIYFAMLTLAFAQLVWVIVFNWQSLTGGDNGLLGVDFPPYLNSRESFYYFCLVLVSLCLFVLWRVVHSPFGRILTAIRDNAERVEFIAINVRQYQLIAFVISGIFAATAGALFAILNHSVFPEYCHWKMSTEALIMTLLGGMYSFFGPMLGALALIWLKLETANHTEYWPLIMGGILCALILFFPSGLAGIAGSAKRFIESRRVRK